MRLALQVALVLWGVLAIFVAAQGFALDRQMAATLPNAVPGQDFHVLPLWQRLTTGIAMGLFDLGLGGVLITLRRLWVRLGFVAQKPWEDAPWETSLLVRRHEQTEAPDLPHHELA